MTGDIRTERQGAWGVVTLTRERALNALTTEMCAAIDDALAAWATDEDVRAVLIAGAGERAFCAGGDVRWLAETARDDPERAATFFRTEYRLNTRLHRYAKPVVALMDGIVMGGGVGLSAPAAFRIVTERTVWALPECAIGLIPDVGASWHLGRIDQALATYIALSGARLSGEEALAAGLADALVPSETLGDLRRQLLSQELGSEPRDVLASLQPPSPSIAEATARLRAASAPFGDIGSVEEALSRLDEDTSDMAAASRRALAGSSPTSLKLALRLLREAQGTFDARISREFRVAAHLMEGPDFLEGVRAQVIEKDRTPRWRPSMLGEVTRESLDRCFEVPPGGDLDLSDL